MRSANPSNSPFSSVQSVLPDIPRSISSSRIRSKKRVRFASTLESIEETSTVDVPISIEIKTKKRTIDPWRDEGTLYNAYLEYLERSQTTNIENSNSNRNFLRQRLPSSNDEIESPSPTFTTTYVLPKSKMIESVSYPLPPMHLPRIIERTVVSPLKKTSTKKTSPIRQRFQLDGIPPRPQSMKKLSNSSKREDLTPPLKFASTPRQKKLVDVMNNPLTNASNVTTKKSSTRTNDELFFFTSCHADHIQPIIH